MDNDSLTSLDLTLDQTSGHAHSSRCWWDFRQPGWVCPPATPPVARTAASTAYAGRVDVRDMLVVHTAMLREFRLLPDAVAGVPDGDRARARVVDGHLGLLCDLMHHHHEGEDELLWPVLRPRLSAAEVALVELVETQHAGIDRSLGEVAAARRSWLETVDGGRRDRLVEALRALSRLLTEHIEAEERHLLPLAAAHLTEAEWHAVGEAGAASVPRSALPLVFGMFAYEGDPEVLALMLRSAPAVPRVLVPRIAPRVYARRAARVHGTRTP